VYSIQAVRTYGIAKGLLLTGGRLIRCFPNVPYGTLDPVPPAASELMPKIVLEAIYSSDWQNRDVPLSPRHNAMSSIPVN
jgi:hypothetical protein